MNKLLLALLRRFLTLGAGEGDPEESGNTGGEQAPEEGAEGAAPDITGDATLDDLLEEAEPTPAKKAPGAGEDVSELRARAERAERALAERSVPAAPARPGTDPEFDREEAQIAQAERGGATPEQMSWLRWQISVQRQVRAGERQSQQNLTQAQDLTDKAAFDRLEITKPKIYKRYNDRIESTIADMRSKGQAIPPRLVLLRVFLGDDLLNEKLKPRSSKPASEAPNTSVPRGRSPGLARSDVNSKSGGKTEHQKRIERLEGRLI